MMRKIVLIAVASFFMLKIYSQDIQPPVNCTSSIQVCDSVIIQDTLKVAIDSTADEISSNSCLTFGEIRGTWYQFGVNDTGNLRFTITPFDTLTDFDWALYRIDWGNCTDIFSMPSYEVSCNESGVGGGFYTTGASGLVQQGHNPAINLTTPAIFYLYITTSLQDTGALLGYTVDFSASDFDLAGCTEIGIEEENGNKFSFYPNPVENILLVELNNSANAMINLYDLSGRNVLAYRTSTEIFSMDLSNLVSGIYIIEVQTEKGISRKKIVKN